MKGPNTWDAIVLGGGIIGISLARELRKSGAEVLLVERGEPGREASHAAAGMLSPSGGDLPAALLQLGEASLKLYSEFVHEIEDESGMSADFRQQGSMVFGHEAAELKALTAQEVIALEPCVEATGRAAAFCQDAGVDPRALTAASLKAARHRGVDV